MESWVVWTFVHKTSENQLPAALLPSAPTGTLGEGLVLRPSPRHTPEPAGQQHRKCQPLSPEQLAPITQTQLETLSWGKAGTPDARPDRKSYTQTKAALQPRQHATQWLVGGWGRQPEGRLGPSSQGSSCGSGRLACSLISEPLHYHNQQLPITGHPERAEFFWSSFYWTPPITQQRRNCYPHLHEGPEAHKDNDLSHHHRDRKCQDWVKSPGLLHYFPFCKTSWPRKVNYIKTVWQWEAHFAKPSQVTHWVLKDGQLVKKMGTFVGPPWIWEHLYSTGTPTPKKHTKVNAFWQEKAMLNDRKQKIKPILWLFKEQHK